jgi:hypothetical protein
MSEKDVITVKFDGYAAINKRPYLVFETKISLLLCGSANPDYLGAFKIGDNLELTIDDIEKVEDKFFIKNVERIEKIGNTK